MKSSLAIAAMAGLSSCVHQWPDMDAIEHNVVINVYQDTDWLPDFMYEYTRAGAQDMEIRYDFRIYHKGNTEKAVREFTIFSADMSRPDFSTTLYLTPGDYDLYMWSDFCDPSGDKALYYDDSNFSAITIKTPYQGNTDLGDAFRGMTSFTVDESYESKPNVQASITLHRPVARYVFIATDLEEFVKNESTRGKLSLNDITSPGFDANQMYLNLSKYRIRVDYPLYMPAVFNNFQNNPVDSWTGMYYDSYAVQISSDMAQLAMDYVLVNGDESTAQVMLQIYDDDNEMIAKTNTISVPIKRNRTTYIYGPFLTTLKSGSVGINPDFEGEYNIEFR